jgi:hypothetical protein
LFRTNDEPDIFVACAFRIPDLMQIASRVMMGHVIPRVVVCLP